MLVDCREALAREGLAALAVRRVPHPAPPAARYFNTTPLGRAVTGTLLVRAMAEHGVEIWGDGSTYKGNDIERFYRYGLLANASLRIYKPWLDEAFVAELGGRKEMCEWLAERGPPARHAPSRRRTRPTPTCSARRTRRRTSSCSRPSMKIVEPIMGVAYWDPAVEIEPEVVTIAFEHGVPVAIDGVQVLDPVELVLRSERDRRPPRPRHVRPDREPHHRGEEPRDLRGARAWRSCTSRTSGC